MDESVMSPFAPFCRTLTVKNPMREDAASRWLTNKSQTELRAVVQHGNPQEIIPYAIALTSHLNQVMYEHSYIAKLLFPMRHTIASAIPYM